MSLTKTVDGMSYELAGKKSNRVKVTDITKLTTWSIVKHLWLRIDIYVYCLGLGVILGLSV